MAKYNLNIADETGSVSMEAVLNKMGGIQGALRFLRGELILVEPKRKWREEDGVIYFTLTSDGTTGPEWITRLEKAGYRLDKWAKDLLSSPDFAPTEPGTLHEIAVLKGMLWNDSARTTKNIHAEAEQRRGLATPHPEVACLIRANFTDDDIKAMGLWWIAAMHEPIEDSGGSPYLLGAHQYDGGCWLGACCDDPNNGWSRQLGFAFAATR